MAEPDNSNTVTEENSTPSTPEAPEETAQTKTTSQLKTVPVKASPLQKSFLERRKAREGASKPAGAEGTTSKGTPADAAADSDSADPRKSAARTGGVRRTAADPDKVKKIGLRILAAVALIAVVVAGTLFGIGKYRYNQTEELRAEYAAFAEQVTVNLTTLTPSNVDRLQKTLLEETSGYAKQQMEQAVGQTVALVKQGQMSTKTTVLSTAVTRADPERGSAIMVFGWTSTPKDPKQETAVETYRWRVDMTRINGQLKLTNFEWVW